MVSLTRILDMPHGPMPHVVPVAGFAAVDPERDTIL